MKVLLTLTSFILLFSCGNDNKSAQASEENKPTRVSFDSIVGLMPYDCDSYSYEDRDTCRIYFERSLARELDEHNIAYIENSTLRPNWKSHHLVKQHNVEGFSGVAFSESDMIIHAVLDTLGGTITETRANYTEFTYKKGKLVKEQYWNRKGGQLLKEVITYNGMLIGPDKTWYESGQQKSELIYGIKEIQVDSIRTKQTTVWNKGKYWYESGQLENEFDREKNYDKAWNENGNPIVHRSKFGILYSEEGKPIER